VLSATSSPAPWSRLATWALAGAFGFLAFLGCQEPEKRPQLVLYVDLDLPVSSQSSELVSTDAIVDSLRVDVFASDRSLIDSRVFSISSVDTLPLAFGIRSDASDGKVIVRVRAFRAALASPITEGDVPVLSPRTEVSVDRLLDLELPTEGVVERGVVLRGDCIGKPVRFGLAGAANRSCVDGDRLDAPATDGIDEEALATSVVGSWSLAAVLDCAGEPPPGALCVPGGFAVLGDPLFVARSEFEIDATPLVPLSLHPFFMDRTEVTVGELRALVAGGYDGPLPTPRNAADPIDRHCSWDPSSSDQLPVNCISADLADAVCLARGGLVPSERRDHVARGRGERRVRLGLHHRVLLDERRLLSARHVPPEGPAMVASTGEEGCPDVSDGLLDSMAAWASSCVIRSPRSRMRAGASARPPYARIRSARPR
jgi:hypothetical protein